jgi:D-beta-D-heptose 7-phosphate kinase/D-beta-D-heptose 1-phosphate adenosyltransferase
MAQHPSCFDVLHAGQVQLLEHARRLGDHLVVCLNSDASVRRLKGQGRPLIPAADRAAVLGSLACVDDVVVFDERGAGRCPDRGWRMRLTGRRVP